jgi:hypothetical protein
MTSTRPQTLVLVDSAVKDSESLINHLHTNAGVVVLNPNQDGVDQITAALTEHSSVESLHILSHGDAGKVYLGSTQLSADTLDFYTDQLQHWASSLTPNADILLYGCDVAAGEIGQQFVQKLSQITHANIAASTNLTGDAEQGGDWNLEYTVGDVQTPIAFSEAAIAAYPHTLGLLFAESFTGSDVADKSFVVGSDAASNPPFLTARSSASDPAPFPEGTIGGLPGGTLGDAEGSGALRLTGLDDTATFTIYRKPIAASQGISITFDFFAYGGVSSGGPGDGISFFLLDATQPTVTAGGFGGSLGYAQSGTTTGIEGGYVGVGFDEFGNFSNPTENRVGGPGRTEDAIAVRGSEANNYQYLTGTGSLTGGIDFPTAPNRDAAKRTAKIDITPAGILSVQIDLNGDGDFLDVDEAPAWWRITVRCPPTSTLDLPVPPGQPTTTTKFAICGSRRCNRA